jgi:GH15 family glucan-1,4-alpha-glucosidase
MQTAKAAGRRKRHGSLDHEHTRGNDDVRLSLGAANERHRIPRVDLYSAAKRLGHPFHFTSQHQHDALPIGAHGLIGDGVSCALVRVDGAIDWACMPRFDSPSVFGALLDPARGGLTSIRPSTHPFESLQRYDPDTNVLETLFTVPGQGVVRLTDFMPWGDDPRASIHEIHRHIQCVEGEVGLHVVFDPRFDYGTVSARFDVEGDGILATSANGETLAAILDGARWSERPTGGLETTLKLRSNERRWMVLSWNAPSAEPIQAYRSFEHLRNTRKRWREWSARLTYDGPWRHHVLRSALLLKLLIHAPTGAMIAAPTASLPEWIGGGRNWDYRFTWTRDAAMAIRAANLIGYDREARDFFHFVRDAVDRWKGELLVMYTVDGHAVPEERELEHFAGYGGSRPVRVGNGARHQLQLDIGGALVDAAWLYERFGGSLTLRAWREVRRVIETVRRRWPEPDHGIREPRGLIRHNVHSKLMCWLALDRGQRLAALFGDRASGEAWRSAAKDVREDVLARGLDSTGKHFVAAYGEESVDASLLLLPIHDFLEPKHPLVTATIERVCAELGHGAYLYRYRTDDGVGGPEGAFVLCGFWLAEALALAGRLEEAQEVFVAHAEASNHLGLLAEEIDPTSGALLGNFPQAFSHLGLINAAARIDRALRLRDEGSRAVPHLVDSLMG